MIGYKLSFKIKCPKTLQVSQASWPLRFTSRKKASDHWDAYGPKLDLPCGRQIIAVEIEAIHSRRVITRADNLLNHINRQRTNKVTPEHLWKNIKSLTRIQQITLEIWLNGRSHKNTQADIQSIADKLSEHCKEPISFLRASYAKESALACLRKILYSTPHPAKMPPIPEILPTWMIVYEDASVSPQIFDADHRKAKELFGEISQSWNAHLFRKVESNCD